MASSADTTLVPLHRLDADPVEAPEPEVTDTCPECDGQVRSTDHETACADCGLVLDTDYLDHGPEWRGSPAKYLEASPGNDPRRTGPPRTVTRHDRGLGTSIGHDNADPRLAFTQRRLHKRAQLGSKTDRGKVYAFGELRRLVDALGLPTVVLETACQLFEQAQDAGLAQGRSYETVAGAALVASGRIHGEPVTFDAVDRASRHAAGPGGKDDIYTVYQTVVDELGVPVPPPDAATLVPGLCRELGLDASVRTEAEAWCRAYGDALVGSGRNPRGVAAAAVYDAAGGQRNPHGVTQADVGDAAGVTPVTLRACWQAVEDG